MSLQMLVVGVIVLACAIQAAWMLMPGTLRATTATALLRLPLPWPSMLAARLRKAASGAASGCGSGCDSCGSVKPDTANTVKPITIHRRLEVSARTDARARVAGKASAQRAPPTA